LKNGEADYVSRVSSGINLTQIVLRKVELISHRTFIEYRAVIREIK